MGNEIVKCKDSYLQGEFNAVEACSQAIVEASSAIKGKLNKQSELFALLEFQGIMIRASMLINEKNKRVFNEKAR